MYFSHWTELFRRNFENNIVTINNKEITEIFFFFFNQLFCVDDLSDLHREKSAARDSVEVSRPEVRESDFSLSGFNEFPVNRREYIIEVGREKKTYKYSNSNFQPALILFEFKHVNGDCKSFLSRERERERNKVFLTTPRKRRPPEFAATRVENSEVKKRNKIFVSLYGARYFSVG